jgi:hypothetical protein
MGVGIYSALGEADDEVLAILKAFGDALEHDGDPLAVLPDHARPAGAIAVMQIRAFEARVGQRTGVGVQRVRARGTMPIEFGNRGHTAFGPAHWNAAEVVARALADLLTALGATDVHFITVD